MQKQILQTDASKLKFGFLSDLLLQKQNKNEHAILLEVGLVKLSVSPW